MRTFEKHDATPFIKHRLLKIPHFFHTASLIPYHRHSSEIRVHFDPLIREVRPAAEETRITVVPEERCRSAVERLSGEIILVPFLPPEEEVYRRIEALAEPLAGRGNALLILLDAPPFPPLPPDATVILNLYDYYTEAASAETLADALGTLPAGQPLVLLYPLLPGITDGKELGFNIKQIKDLRPGASILPILPIFNHAGVDHLLKIARERGTTGRSATALFQTPRSNLGPRLLEAYYEQASSLGVTGIIPIHFRDQRREMNTEMAQRTFLLWHALMESGEEAAAWEWYRAGSRIAALDHDLTTLAEEENLSLLNLGRQVTQALRDVIEGKKRHLDPIEKRWL